MGKMKKKYESGAATAFVGRNQAIKKLQLTIADFRRLCILKGIYPVEPNNKKKVNKGTTANRTYYYVKDINYLAHEPIINKFREFKIYVKRLKRAKGRRDVKQLGKLRNSKPSYKIDHIVKERYPSFTDALKDLDDCLSLIFLFANLPKSKRVYVERVHLAKRLSLEFMHYVIASKSLRKCFISIKGYYFQAEVKGLKVTWIMPHKLAYQTPDDVDFRIMSTFVEFYSSMLGFVNYKTYTDLGLIYPPKLSISSQAEGKKSLDEESDINDEYLASLNCDFIKLSEVDPEAVGDEFNEADEENLQSDQKSGHLEEESINKLKNLFAGLKFYLNREIPREQFVFAIRAFSGQVSWDKTVGVGATFDESDESITHHIVDRPLTGVKTHLNRVYVQPQWVFDCINENMLLPVDDYLPGAPLPPHLSPFVDVNDGDYVPPERQRLNKLKLGIKEEIVKTVDAVEDKTTSTATTTTTNGDKQNGGKKTVKKETVVELKKNGSGGAKKAEKKMVESDEEEEEELENGMRVDIDTPDEQSSDEERDEIVEEEESSIKTRAEKPIIKVVKAKPVVENINKLMKKKADEDKKLTEMTIPRRDKRLYDRIMHSKKKKRQEVVKLEEKRAKIEQQTKKKSK